MAVTRDLTLKGVQKFIITTLCASLTILIFYTAFMGSFDAIIQRSFFLMFMIPIIFLLVPASKTRESIDKIPLRDIFLSIIAAISFGWILLNYGRIACRIKYVSELTNLDLIFGTIAILLVMEVTRRTLGWIIVIITSVFIGYVFIGPYLPGVLMFRKIPFDLFIDQMYLTQEGLFNIMTGLTSTYLYTFVAFGTFLQVTGAGKYFMDICLALAGKARGGPAKVAVFSSALVGTISGSTISNVVITGSLTIPMMKDTGFKPKDAAAIETAASTGGALTPPIMGAGVFIMSAIAGIPLLTIIKLSVIPAILYYTSLYIWIEIKAVQYNLKGIPENKLPKLNNVLKKSYFLFIPLILLVALLVKGYSPFVASASCTVLIVLFSYLGKETRMDIRKIIMGLRLSAESMMTITAVSACAAIIVGSLTLTGLILKISSILIAASNGILIIVIFFLIFLCYILGMGLPVTLSYLLIAMLGASALIQLGVPILAAHLMLFWYANIATISPPVCMTAFVAAEIAQEKDYMKVGFTALNVDKAIFLIPFFFVYTSILDGTFIDLIKVFLLALPLIFVLNVFVEGYSLSGKLKKWERTIMGISLLIFGFAIFSKNLTWSLACFGLGLLITVIVLYNQKKQLIVR